MDILLFVGLIFAGLFYISFPILISHPLMDLIADWFSERKWGFNFSVNMAVIGYFLFLSIYFGIPLALFVRYI